MSASTLGAHISLSFLAHARRNSSLGCSCSKSANSRQVSCRAHSSGSTITGESYIVKVPSSGKSSGGGGTEKLSSICGRCIALCTGVDWRARLAFFSKAELSFVPNLASLRLFASGPSMKAQKPSISSGPRSPSSDTQHKASAQDQSTCRSVGARCKSSVARAAAAAPPTPSAPPRTSAPQLGAAPFRPEARDGRRPTAPAVAHVVSRKSGTSAAAPRRSGGRTFRYRRSGPDAAAPPAAAAAAAAPAPRPARPTPLPARPLPRRCRGEPEPLTTRRPRSHVTRPTPNRCREEPGLSSAKNQACARSRCLSAVQCARCYLRLRRQQFCVVQSGRRTGAHRGASPPASKSYPCQRPGTRSGALFAASRRPSSHSWPSRQASRCAFHWRPKPPWCPSSARPRRSHGRSPVAVESGPPLPAARAPRAAPRATGPWRLRLQRAA
eukprot:scaffold851_cov67-Phaeocystis_antarctica.AAC.2